MTDNLQSRTTRALMWSAADRFGEQILRFLFTVFLARLLTPSDFGLIGMMMVFILIAEVVVTRGVPEALIQKESLSADDLTTGLVMNLASSVVLYSVVVLSSGAIARFYSQPELATLTPVIGSVIVFDALITVKKSQLTRRLDFRTLLRVNLVATTVSGVVGIGLAWKGFGAWSLIALVFMNKMILTILLLRKTGLALHGQFSRDSFHALFSYGWKLQLSGIFTAAFDNIHALIIGRFFAVDIVGYYTKARNIKNLPVHSLSAIVSRVTFPVFSSLQQDLPRLKRGLRRSISMLVLVAFPLMIGMTATADRFVPVVLGEQWLPTVPFLQVLCLSGLLYVLHASLAPIPKAIGRTDISLKLSLAKKLVSLLAIIIAIRWGVYALVISQVVSSYIAYLLNASVAGRLIEYPFREQMRDIAPCFVLASLMGVVVYAAGVLLPIESDALVLVIQLITGVSVYTGLCHLAGVQSWQDLLKLHVLRPATTSVSDG